MHIHNGHTCDVIIAIGSADNTARAWTSHNDNSVVIFKGHGSAVLCMTASEPDRELYTSSADGTARSWNVETGQAIRVFEGHQAPVTCLQVSWSNCLCFCVN